MSDIEVIELLKSDIMVLNNYLKSRPDNVNENYFEDVLIKDMQFAISILNKQQNKGWIPVSEGLPEEYLCKDGEYDPSEFVLIQLDNGNMKTSRYWNHRRCKERIIEQPWLDISYYEKVTAWQPLPEKYKGSE